MSETTCPLCRLPRLRNATRCACNYVFEYDTPRAGSADGPGARSPLIVPLLLVIGVAGAVGGAMIVKPATDGTGSLGLATLFMFIGLFVVTAAIANWSWFMLAGRARLVSMLLTRTGARMFYAALGGGFVGAALGMGVA